jgi:D-amino-acid dehydrogenase
MTFEKSKQVAVIGAGITGITTAYQLCTRGADVTVFEANPYAAMETSYANGGQLSASNAEVWNSLATIRKGVKWMFNAGAPLLLNPKPSWHKYSWLAEFLRAIPSYQDNTVQTVRWAIEARAQLTQMAEAEGVAFDRVERGILHFYETKAQFDVAERVTALLRKGGLTRRAVAPDEIAQIEPALRGDLYAGFYTESDFTGDIHKFAAGLAKACARRGVTLQYGAPVSRLAPTDRGASVRFTPEGGAPEQQEFDQVVICAGVRSRDFAAMLGDRLNIYPVKDYSITVHLDEAQTQAAAPWTSLLDDDAKLVTSRLGADRFRVAGTAEFNGYSKDIRWARIAPMLDWCRKHFPGMSTENYQSWAGLRPMMPNMMPRVGPGKRPGVFYNTGHGHLGWTLSGATSDIVASLMSDAARA